jgi:hypothetical protein
VVKAAEMRLFLPIALLGVLLSTLGWARTKPTGQATLNQGISARTVTKSDATILPGTRGLYVGDAAACNLAVVFQADNVTGAGTAVTFTNVQPGSFLPLQVAKVMSTNTTCTLVLALY